MRLASSLLVLGIGLAAPPVRAQAGSVVRFARMEAAEEQDTTIRTTSLESHLALGVAERLIASDRFEDRVRGVERFAASGQREGVDRILRMLESASPAAKDLRVRLVALRALAPFAAKQPVCQMLAKALAVDPVGLPLRLLLRDTAALALAASGDRRSLDALAKAIAQGGAIGDSAARALFAHPPASLEAFESPSGLGPQAASFFAELGDVRAIPMLRATLLRGLLRTAATVDSVDLPSEAESRQAQAAAALALVKLGDREPIEVARRWAASFDRDMQWKGVEILVASGAAGSRPLLTPFLSSPSSRGPALSLAARAPAPELVPALEGAARSEGAAGRLALVTLGRVGTARAVATLRAAMNRPERAWDAAMALARAPSDDARRALEGALADRSLERL
ncbi:MAG TPA: hypothetical protein VJT73_15760, partial [Polyangiaceae bacterium]|nr:hypothetical protein [Polyangiaceae bacterium]